MAFGFGPLPPAKGGFSVEDLATLFSPGGLAGQGQPAFQPPDEQVGFLARRRLLRDAEDGAAQAGLLSGNAMGQPGIQAPSPDGFTPGQGSPLQVAGIQPAAPVAPEMSVPLPPQRPSAADLGPLSFGPLPPASPTLSRQRSSDSALAQTPPQASGAMPGLVGSPLPPPRPSDLGLPASPVSPADMPVPNAVPAQAQAPADSGFDFGGAMDRFAKRGGFDLLGNIGMGLMSTKGFTPGLVAGLQANQKQEALRATTDLARAEFGLKARKAGQADTGLNVTRAQLIAKGNAPADVDTAIAASQAGQDDPLKSLLARAFPKAAEAPAGFTLNPDGSMRRIVGGPQDPTVKREDARATAEGSAAGKPDEPFNLSAGQTRYNADGTPIVSAGTSSSDVFDRETKLRGEFTKQLGTFQDVHDGYGRVIAATEQRQVNPNAKSPAADIGLIFGFMKMLDPGSVVREGEYATAQNAASVPERVRNAYNKAMSGEFLTPEQRQGFIEQAESLYGKARGGAEGVAERYRGIASQYGVDPGRSVYLPDPYKAPKVGASRTKAPEVGAPLDIGGTRDAGGGITIKRVR